MTKDEDVRDRLNHIVLGQQLWECDGLGTVRNEGSHEDLNSNVHFVNLLHL